MGEGGRKEGGEGDELDKIRRWELEATGKWELLEQIEVMREARTERNFVNVLPLEMYILRIFCLWR